MKSVLRSISVKEDDALALQAKSASKVQKLPPRPPRVDVQQCQHLLEPLWDGMARGGPMRVQQNGNANPGTLSPQRFA